MTKDEAVAILSNLKPDDLVCFQWDGNRKAVGRFYSFAPGYNNEHSEFRVVKSNIGLDVNQLVTRYSKEFVMVYKKPDVTVDVKEKLDEYKKTLKELRKQELKLREEIAVLEGNGTDIF